MAVLCNASATRTVRASVDVIVRHSGADRYPDPSEALLLSGNVTGSEPASCICVLAAECRSDCVQAGLHDATPSVQPDDAVA